MGTKKITELQLISLVTDDVNFPGDDSIQTYRITAAQLKAFVLATGNVGRSALAASEQMPIGAVLPYAGSSAPTGYLLCDGSAVSRTTYAALFAILASTHGQGNGTSTFNLPDYRGRFMRGVDHAQGRDPDRASRTVMATGGNTGDNVGSIQGHAFQTHTHVQNAHGHTFIWSNLNDGNGDYVRSGSGASGTGNLTGQTTAVNQNASASGTFAQASANETRPVNAFVEYIIKY